MLVALAWGECSEVRKEFYYKYVEFKFSQLFVFSTIDTFTLVDGEGNDSLVVFNSSESTFLDTRNGSISRYD